MLRPVSFIDTSVVCNILPIPDRDQDRERVLDEMRAKQKREVLILPVTAVIETGNFIAHLPGGNVRRTVARKFSDMLELVIEGRACILTEREVYMSRTGLKSVAIWTIDNSLAGYS